MFVCASIGDCKIYHYSASTKTFSDITYNNREDSLDPSDPGGRLGPFGKTAAPDLRNLDLYSTVCCKGDLIICVSDGVHDNLDPQLLGITPSELSIKDYTTWEEVPPSVACIVKSKFALRLLNILHNDIDEPLTAKRSVNILINHALKVTSTTREWAQLNPRFKLPEDYRKFPGKVDHTTCVAFEVGTSYQGLSPIFDNFQNSISTFHKKYEKLIQQEQIKLSNQFYQVNMPLQVTVCSTEKNIILYCRTIHTGSLSVLHEEQRVFIKVIASSGISNYIPENELSDITIHGSDELDFPIERTINLPYPINTSDSAIDILVDKQTGLITITLERKIYTKRSPVSVALSSTSEGDLTSSDSIIRVKCEFTASH